jgi:hypothetical protein
MTAELRPGPLGAAARRVSRRRRLSGFGSVFGKTIRDSRAAFLLIAVLLSTLMFAFGRLFVDLYPTAIARQQLLVLVASFPPIARALFYGASPVRLDTLGGYISQDDGLLLKLILTLPGGLASSLSGPALTSEVPWDQGPGNEGTPDRRLE